MKKLLFVLIMALTFSGMTGYAKSGDIIGVAYNTDIVAYINNYAIPSYAVNGTSCIVAEDLRNFCFDVSWDSAARSLNIFRNNYSQPIGMNFSKTGVPSTKFADLLETDISVYAKGKRITSYAINGYTMIPIEELNVFGDCVWVESERSIKLWIEGINVRGSKQKITSTSHSTNQVEYYPGTNIPTYTSVTGVSLKSQDLFSNGSPLYQYTFTSADDVIKYWDQLSSSGWTLYKGDDKSTTNKFESCYTKGLYILVLNVYRDFNEVWITFALI